MDRAVEGGVHTVTALGRVGEVMYLTMEERKKAITTVVDQVAGRVPVGCGCIDLTFEDGLELGRIARTAGADFIMSRASVDGDPIEYYRRLAEIIPVMVYDQGVQREMRIIEDIVPLVEETGNVVALKISGLQEKVTEAKEVLDIPILCGHEIMLLMSYRMGADGACSAFAMLSPHEEVKLYDLAMDKRWDEARDLFYGTHLPLVNYLPGGPGMMGWSIIKNILYWEGVIESPLVRTPSLPASEARLAEARLIWDRIGSPAAV